MPPRIRLSAVLGLAVIVAVTGISFRTRSAYVLWIGPLVTTFLLTISVLGLITAADYLRRQTSAPSLTERQAAATRPLSIATDKTWTKCQAQRKAENEATFTPVHGFEDPHVAARLDSVLRLIRSSFILPWFNKISRAPAFPNAVEGVVRHALGEVAGRVETVDWPSLGVAKILPIVTDHLAHYRSVEHLASSIGTSDALPLPLPKDAHPTFTRHTHTSAESNVPSIEAHLREHVERIVASVVPQKEQTPVVKAMTREIVLGAILMPVFNMLCVSDFWNRQINEKGGKYLHQRQQVNQVLSALSAAPPSTASTGSAAPEQLKRMSVQPININSTPRQFEDFMRSILRLRTLGEARRMRSDIDREYRRARASFGDATMRAREAGEDNEKEIRRIERYLHRLERARGQIDRRIQKLSGDAGSPQLPVPPVGAASKSLRPTLHRILSDPSSLAYWLEFMERRNRSHLVQFWLTVEGFKDPLEASDQNLALENVLDAVDRPSPNDATFPDDIAFLYSAYFADGTDGQHKIDIPPRLVGVISELGQNTTRPFTASDTRRGRIAVYQAQKAVYEQMEERDWAAFQKSDLYFKALADLKPAAPQQHASRGSPSMESSARLTPSAPRISNSSPFNPVRRVSDGPSLKSPSPDPSPLLPRRPLLVNGSFIPATTSPAATPVVTTDYDTSMRDVGSDQSGHASPHASVILSPGPKRRSAQFDVLFGSQGEEVERNPLFVDEEDEEAAAERQRIQALQAALEEIINSDPMADSLVLEPPEPPQTPQTPQTPLHPLAGKKLTSRSAEDLQLQSDLSPARPVARYSPGSRRPKIARRGSDEGVHRRQKSIFAEDEEEEPDAPVADSEGGEEEGAAAALAPAAGNLHLASEIERLTGKVDELCKQESTLSALISKADLHGDKKRLRLLQRSLSSVERELRTAEFQKEQLERQERENRLVPGRTHVTLPSAIQAEDETTGRPLTKYVVQIDQVEDGRTLLSWRVMHRYSEFYTLDRALRDWGATDPQIAEEVRAKVIEMPGKRLVPSTSAGFVEARRLGLERYLQSLLTSAVFCASPILQNFLSQGPPEPSAPTARPSASRNLVKTLYKTVASSIDVDLAPSMLDMMTQSLTRQLSEVAGGIGVVTEEVSSLLPIPTDEGTAFAAPICDLFLEVFDLKERDWLRRQAIVLLLQQWFGATVERKVRDIVGRFSRPESVEKLLANFQENMWPGGVRRQPAPKRTPEEIKETRLSASRKLGRLLPDMLSNVIGRRNSRKAAQRVFAVIQDPRLNQHLWVKVLDEVLYALFPVAPAAPSAPPAPIPSHR